VRTCFHVQRETVVQCVAAAEVSKSCPIVIAPSVLNIDPNEGGQSLIAGIDAIDVALDEVA
jgi:hypothetical protein